MSQTPSSTTKEKLYDEFNTVVAETEQLLKTVATAGSDKAGAAARATDEYVQGNPWRAVGIVAAAGTLAGLLVGLLIARR